MSAHLDLHLHTTASDGSLPPRAVVQAAAAAGVTLLAITDHDTTEGVGEAVAAGRELGVTVVPGVELSADTETHDLHLLGYYLRWEDPGLQEALQGLQARRTARNARIFEKLTELGLPVDPQRVREIGGHGSLGRPHIAEAMVEQGYVNSVGEAFYRYLGRNRPAFAPRARLSVAEVVRIITHAGGLAALAHPAKVGSWEVVGEVLARGVGVEAYHSDHSGADTERLLGLARVGGLLVTGGTDSHGPRSDRPGTIGSVTIPTWVREQFLARAPEWWRERESRD